MKALLLIIAVWALFLMPQGVQNAESATRTYRKSKLTRDESEGKADRRKLLLAKGENKSIDLDFEVNGGVGGIQIGDEKIVKATLVKIGEKRQIVFTPLQAGDTSVTIRDADGTLRLIFAVKVTGSNLMKQAHEIRDLLKDIEGIEIKIVGRKVVIDGEVLVPADYGRLYQVVAEYNKPDTNNAGGPIVMNLATLSPLALQILAKRIQEDVNSFAPNVHTRVVNGVIFLEGTVDDVYQARRAEDVAVLYLPEVRSNNQAVAAQDPNVLSPTSRKFVRNFIVVNAPPPKKAEKLVRITAHFVELDKDYSRNFGFKWAPGFTADPQIQVGTTGNGGLGGAGTSFSATLSSLFPKLQSAQEAGYARVLKTGTMIVRSGQPTSLIEQMNYPVQTTAANGQTNTQYVNVGFNVAVTPSIVGQSDDIQLTVKLKQVNFSGAGVGGAPITNQHEMNTDLYIKSSESAAVGGFDSTEVGTEFNKNDPSTGTFQQTGGATTEPLFSMVRTKRFHKARSNFVVFLTPQIVENASEGSEDLKKNFRVKVK